jgi:CubicO group peptidase (beta-lactamase class C family)
MPGRFTDAIAYAQAHETPWPRDPADDPARWGVHHGDPPPYNRLRGPVHARGGVAGAVWQSGREVCAWGDADRADLCFSVAKSALAVVVGVAQSRGLLPDVHEPVVERVPGIGFEGAHNAAVTWLHLLQQTSEWEGECFGVPDTVDRWRAVAHDPRPPAGRKGEARPLRAPGTYWEYNDVRINQLALALLHRFGRPLPEVLDEAVMRPLGCSPTWRWIGYDDAWVTLQGRRMPSVPGGSHWGGGLSIGSRDLLRLGVLLLNAGQWQGHALLPGGWVQQLRTPCAVAPYYGALTWLNSEARVFPGASADAFFMVGAGGHIVWIEPAHDAVVVVRWLESAHTEGFMRRMSEALGRA